MNINWFLGKVEKTDACWLWCGCIKPNGYGSISNRGNYHGKTTWYAHRLSWVLFKGEIPTGMQVLHKCDVRSCVNPDHLFLGTQQDNMKDMCDKGRHSKVAVFGAKHHNAKLDKQKVLMIRELSKTCSQDNIAKKYGVAQSVISGVVRGESWKHVSHNSESDDDPEVMMNERRSGWKSAGKGDQ